MLRDRFDASGERDLGLLFDPVALEPSLRATLIGRLHRFEPTSAQWRHRRRGQGSSRPPMTVGRRDGLERYRIKQQTKVALAEALRPRARQRRSAPARDDESAGAPRRHRRPLAGLRIDVARLLDFPLMTDMRDPLTIAFHKARSHADLLRPDNVDDILDDRDAQLEYRDAVHEYVAAFDVAEAEATRRRRSDFSADAQERLERAQHLLRLASDRGATNEERKAAYARAQQGTRRADRAAGRHPRRYRAQIAGEIEA